VGSRTQAVTAEVELVAVVSGMRKMVSSPCSEASS
jgi:hypothetical protein